MSLPFQSWEERADAAFAALFAAATVDQVGIHLHKDDSSSVLKQDFPPLPSQPNASLSPSTSPISVPYSPVAFLSKKQIHTELLFLLTQWI
ncbi:hypothetical protein LguiA_025768 [Lonicera macranthoides]